MQTINTVNDLRAIVANAKREGKRVGFVPTMGNLHAGHISLITAAKQHADFIVASIFVNPMQFGANEDLDAYPRTLADDQAKLSDAGCDLLFAPTVSEMYPAGLKTQTVVAVPALSNKYCGTSRPGHFEGVATVVSKLFNMVQPDIAAFGEKDFQQVMVIRQMVEDLNMPVEIVSVPTARSATGLALSSRNGYLNEAQIALAANLYAQLQTTKQAVLETDQALAILVEEAKAHLESLGLAIDYFDICHMRSLEQAQTRSDEMVILAAVKLGNTRLIDNLTI